MSYSHFPTFKNNLFDQYSANCSANYCHPPPPPPLATSTPICKLFLSNIFVTYVLVNKREVLSDEELFGDEKFHEPTQYHGYEIHMMKNWSILTLTAVDIKKSKYGYHIKNLTDEQMKIITDGLVTVHPKLKLEKREVFLRPHPKVKIIDWYGNELQNVKQLSGPVGQVKIDLQGYKTKNDTILPIWRIHELLFVESYE